VGLEFGSANYQDIHIRVGASGPTRQRPAEERTSHPQIRPVPDEQVRQHGFVLLGRETYVHGSVSPYLTSTRYPELTVRYIIAEVLHRYAQGDGVHGGPLRTYDRAEGAQDPVAMPIY
jgi:hypothetical protein